ncbi:DASH complex subunit ask1 [Podila epigama]|nr:DASH complex subunit ask1 [Podila epigama]
MATPRTTSDILDEIERLEQRITLTLQEIDQDFSNCQTIVTAKILPSIDLYAESSGELWNHARLWLNFFAVAASATSHGFPQQRTKADSNTPQATSNTTQHRRDQSLTQTSTEQPSIQDNLGRTLDQSRIETEKYHDRRESLAFFASDIDIVEGSPLASLPYTPTPPNNRRRISRQALSSGMPGTIKWSEYMPPPQDTMTPNREQHLQSFSVPESTTPTVTARRKSTLFSPYTNRPHYSPSLHDQISTSSVPPRTSTSDTPQTNHHHRHQNLHSSLNGGFLDLDVDQDHQDVVTPPSTLHFSIPESKLATTPRSIVARSKVDRIRMKDGLVIPQPIFVRNDNDDTRESFNARNRLDSLSKERDVGIGGSKKRNRNGEQTGDDSNQFNIKERLLASPRKMASIQDFLPISDIGSAIPRQSQQERLTTRAEQVGNSDGHDDVDVDDDDVDDAVDDDDDDTDEDGRQSPSRRLMSQIRSQSDKEYGSKRQELSLKAVADYRAAALKAPEGKGVSAHTFSSTPTAFARPRTGHPDNHSILTTAPLYSTSTGINPSSISTLTTTSAITSVHDIFKESFNTGFAATSGGTTLAPMASGTAALPHRRQTVASTLSTPSETSFARASSGGSRSSIGPGLIRASATIQNVTPGRSSGWRAPVSIPSNSRLSLLGTSAFSRKVLPTDIKSPSKSVALNAQDTVDAPPAVTYTPFPSASSVPSTPVPLTPRAQDLASRSKAQNLTRHFERPISSAGSSQPKGYSRSSDSTTIQNDNQHNEHTEHLGKDPLSTPSASSSTFYLEHDVRDEFRTPPAGRNPPPAPRLGYHSDTIMTQSSLGLNHDSFTQDGAGFDDFDRTRTTIGSMSGVSSATREVTELTSGASNAAAIIAASRFNQTSSGATEASSIDSLSNILETRGTTDQSVHSMMTPFDEVDGDGDGDDDEDITGSDIRSPCPPGRIYKASVGTLGRPGSEKGTGRSSFYSEFGNHG